MEKRLFLVVKNVVCKELVLETLNSVLNKLGRSVRAYIAVSERHGN